MIISVKLPFGGRKIKNDMLFDDYHILYCVYVFVSNDAMLIFSSTIWLTFYFSHSYMYLHCAIIINIIVFIVLLRVLVLNDIHDF